MTKIVLKNILLQLVAISLPTGEIYAAIPQISQLDYNLVFILDRNFIRILNTAKPQIDSIKFQLSSCF